VRTFADDYEHSPEASTPISPSLVATSVATRASGGVVFGAKLFGGTDLGAGPIGGATDSTAFFAALDGDGKNAGLATVLTLGPDAEGATDSIHSMKVVSDAQSNTIVSAIVSGAVTLAGVTHVASAGVLSVLIAKLDPNGKVLWSRFTDQATQTYAWGLAVDDSGNVWVAGSLWSGSIDFGEGSTPTERVSSGMYYAKLDPNGKPLFVRAFDVTKSKFSPSFGGIFVDAKGNAVALAPTLTGSVDLGGKMLTPGDTPATFVVRIDASGAVTSAKTFPVVRSITGFTAGKTGDVVLAGECRDTIDLGAGPTPCDGTFLAKLGPSDAVTWVKSFAEPKGASVGSTSTGGALAFSTLALDPAGNIAFGGHLVGDGELAGTALHWTPGKHAGERISSDALVGAFDANGSLLFARAFGDGDSQSTTSVAFDPAGNVVAVGWFAGSITLDGVGTFTSKKADDVFVASFSR
jgi:hypothetical protein